ncbi:hypothetical protein E3U26_12385 [Paracoccus ferrooxidans]|nr:hypothetical protein E3U26_12385 [Paracoccus ferrooxidans]
MADERKMWVVAKSRGQSPDRLWHAPEEGPFRIEAGLFSERWMREATPAEVREATGGGPEPELAPTAKGMDAMTDDELRAHYETVLGEKPHHAMKRETMIERVTERLNAD